MANDRHHFFGRYMKHLIAFILALLFIAAGNSLAQPTFEKVILFGTNAIGTSLLQTPDGGYLVAGIKYGLDTTDLYYDYPCIFKFDAQGYMQWAKYTSQD